MKQEPCKRCKGYGTIRSNGDFRDCPRCWGSGTEYQERDFSFPEELRNFADRLSVGFEMLSLAGDVA